MTMTMIRPEYLVSCKSMPRCSDSPCLEKMSVACLDMVEARGAKFDAEDTLVERLQRNIKHVTAACMPK